MAVIMAVRCKARLVCAMFVHVLGVNVINMLSCQIHTIFASSLKMDVVLQEYTRTDCTSGRR